MDFNKILTALNKNISEKYSAGKLSTESAISAITSDSVLTYSQEEVKGMEKVLEAAKEFESKLTQESGQFHNDGDSKVYVEGTGNFIQSYAARLNDVQANFGNAFESMTTESAQGSEISLAAKTAILVNLGRTNQDEFAEEFFPSILSPEMNQIQFRYTIGSYIKQWKTNNKELLPIHETLVDTSYLQGNTLRLIPAYKANSEYLNTNIEITEVNGVETTKSAPYKFNTKIDILDSCVDEVSIAGIKNNVRTIAPNVKLGAVYFTDGTAATFGTADEVKAVFETHAIYGAVATPSYIGKKEDFQIAFGVDRIYSLPLSAFKNGVGQEAISGYSNHEVNFELRVSGNGNLTTSQVELTVTKFVIKSITEKGNPVPAATATAIMDVIKNIKPEGFKLLAYEANGDVVNEGNVLTLDNDSETYSIGYKQPLTVKGPIANLYNPKTDLSELAQFITHCGDKCSVDAKTLLLDTLSAVKNSQNPSSVVSGIGNRIITPTVVSTAVDISTQIKNMETSNLEGSVKSLLVNVIKTVITKMFVVSKYKAIFNRFYKGRKMRVSVGIDQRLQTWLPVGVYNITPEIDAYVVSTVDNRFDNKIVLAFTSSSEDRNKEIDILGLGFNAYDTTVVTEVRKSIGGSVISAVMAFPKYEHIIMCTVMGEVEVSGIDKVFVG